MLIRRKCCPHIAAALVAVSQWFLFASSAFAQSSGITISTHVERDPEDSRHDLETWPYAINTEDCEKNIITRLSLTLPEQGTLEVYGGKPSTNCYDPNIRATTDSSQCWDILTEYADETQAYKLELLAQDIAGGSCDSSMDQEVTIHVVLTNGGENVAWNKWITLVDLKSPNPPAELDAGIGESRLELEWSTPSGETVSGFRLYCAQAEAAPASTGAAGAAAAAAPSAGTAGGGGAGAANEASAAASAGTSGRQDNTATDSTSSCYSADLVAGEPPGTGAWKCGTINSGSTVRGHTTKLDNNRTYAVAVASIDEIGNLSVLSTPACEAPQELTDFFEEYSNANGRGGGGFCSVSAPQRQPALPVALGAAILALMARRQRRGNQGHR